MAIENGLIILEGNIGAGKTTLAHKISAAIKRLWLKSKKTVAIKVPSIILPSEYDRDFNIILNPEHPDFHLLKIKTVVECPFDLRLF